MLPVLRVDIGAKKRGPSPHHKRRASTLEGRHHLSEVETPTDSKRSSVVPLPPVAGKPISRIRSTSKPTKPLGDGTNKMPADRAHANIEASCRLSGPQSNATPILKPCSSSQALVSFLDLHRRSPLSKSTTGIDSRGALDRVLLTRGIR
jgi:hypothetical protein